MAALMIVLFIVSWLPYCLIAMFGIVGLGHLVTPYSAELPVMLAKASAMWNPILFALKHPRYRSALAGYLPEIVTQWCRLGEPGSRTSSIRRSFATQKHQTAAPAVAVALREAGDVELVQIRHQIPAAAAAAAAGGGGGGGGHGDGGGDNVDTV